MNEIVKEIRNEFVNDLEGNTYYTDKEGRTFDLTSGNEIDIFDIDNV